MPVPSPLECPHCGQAISSASLSGGGSPACPACGRPVAPPPKRTERRPGSPDGGRLAASAPAEVGGTASTSSWRSRGKSRGGEAVRQIGRFQLLAALGRGAFGEVWRAYDPHLDREVALKVPRFDNASDREAERFFREACAAAQLQHPHIVPVYDAGQSDGRLYIATKLIDGLPLAAWLQDHKPRLTWACEQVRKLAEAVDYAHGQGVFHRDIKPANIMLDRRDEPHLMDFGLARRGEEESTLTTEGSVLGTPSYMPPEQAQGRGHQADARSDVYSLGVILYEMLAGRRPFDGPPPVVLHKVIHEEPEPLRKINPRVPRDLEAICLKCLAKEPGRRYASAGMLAEDLRRFLAGLPILARPPGLVERLGRWCRRNPVVAGLVAAVVVVLLAGVGISAHFAVRANERAEEALREQNRANENAQEAIQERDRAAESARQATQEKDRADENARRAEREKGRADQNARQLQAHLYAAHMNMAELAWEKGEVRRVLDLLDRYRQPPAGEKDTRGWEWYYQHRLCHEYLRILRGHKNRVQGIALSPDGTRLASAGEDQSVRIWDLVRGGEARSLPGPSAAVLGVAFSPDGKHVAAAGRDQIVWVWDLDGATEPRVLRGPTATVHCVAFSPDGKRLAAAGSDKLVWVWDLAGDPEPRRFQGHGVEIHGLAFSPDGNRFASVAVDVRLWDLATGQKLPPLNGQPHGFTDVAFSPDGSRLATGCRDGTVQLWDAAPRPDGSFRELARLRGHTARVYKVAFSPDGTRLASAGWDGTARVWDLAKGQELYTCRGHRGTATGVALSPDGAQLISSGSDGTIRVWALASEGGPRVLTGHTGEVRGVAFNRDGAWLASAGTEGRIRLWDVVTGQELFSLQGHQHRVRGVAFSPDGKRLASSGNDSAVRVWELASRQELHTLTGHLKSVMGVAFSPDGARLASGGEDGTVRLWDVESGEQRRVLRGHMGAICSVVFSPDGKWLASASEADHTVRVWDLARGRALHVLQEEWARTVAFSPDGRLLAWTAGEEVKIGDPATGRELRRLKGHTGIVSTLAFSPDGTRLASAGDDRIVRLWDVASGQELYSLAGHADWIWGVAFSPYGMRLASGGEDKTIRLWDARPLTKEVRTEKEAVGLVQFLLDRPLLKEQVKEEIRTHPVISEDVRRRALAFVDRFHEEKDPRRFAEAAWALVRQRYLAPRWYRQALAQAEVACRLDPANGPYHTTLGIAQYRLGMVREALDTLTESDKRNRARAPGARPADLAFLVMARQRLGRKQEAVAGLKRLQQLVKEPRWAEDEEAQGFLREAEATVAPGGPGAGK